MKLLIWVVLVVVPGFASAQTPACAESPVRFEFQVAARAQWLADSAFAVHPAPAVRNPANLVQFVVDTLGIPLPSTFRVLKAADSTLIAEVRRTFGDWRYTPAVLDGCRVRQLVQTPVSR